MLLAYPPSARLSPRAQVPWDDLRYLLGAIMYCGHITNNRDRRFCTAYLATYLHEQLMDASSFPSFEAPPPNLTYKQYIEYIEKQVRTHFFVALRLASLRVIALRQTRVPL